ncbi:lysozyme [Aliivibrio finisterrensis]|uniref:Lysozyme n=1 Tax=Aliivibrio finisterrensis TaxID=511998 RepID=A0A4Q5K6I5_9GAMM|nr:lysozyme [Aliivibrio finisterrensis]RYU41328.1 lysozyme [Aliivibrio finisterrensis]
MKKILATTSCSVALILSIVFSTPNNLKTSPEGLKHIADLEGCRNKAYQCSAGTWTSGIGHTGGVIQGETLTDKEIAANFIQDVLNAEMIVNRWIKVSITQSQFDVLVSFVFNLGSGNFRTSTLLKLFNKNEPVKACGQFMRWVYVNGKNCHNKDSNCAGIVTRRQIERDACLNGWPQ